MWYGWTGYGWWWWWFAFLVVFFLLPLGYGWGYRGWGPWYRRRGTSERHVGEPSPAPVEDDLDSGWGWTGVALWIVLLVALFWLVAAVGWGYW